MIFHITTQSQWSKYKETGGFLTETLTTERFIHCSSLNQLIRVANNLYLGQRNLVLLCIQEDKVKSEVRYEGQNEKYPHIYGELNMDAIVNVIDFPQKKMELLNCLMSLHDY
ncbi:MAG: DUF952 domain-containing protein [Candidatus Hermodarchaeota archaeon]